MKKRQQNIENLLTAENKQQILTAIALAEKNTSGEIRVHLENFLPKNTIVFSRAMEIFSQLGMEKTQDRNGILIYVAFMDKQFAILGDQGINEKVGQDFWDTEKKELLTFFKNNQLIEGLVYFISKAGEKLQAYFPYQKDDVNELADDISLGKN